jgi:hypothetical protein
MEYFVFNKERLLQSLMRVKPGLAKKDIIAQASKFVFKDGHVYTFNDEIAVSHPLEHPLNGVIPADEFYKFISKINDDTIKIATEGPVLYIKDTKSLSVELNIEEEVKLPIADMSSPSLWYTIPDDFNEALTFALLSVGTDLSKPVLTCIHWTPQYIESCDNFRLTRYTINTPDLTAPILLSNKIISNLKNYTPVQFSIADKWAHFKTVDDCIFSCRVYSADYVDLSVIFNKEYNQEIIFTDSMISLLDKMVILAEKDIHGKSKAIMTVTSGIATVQTHSGLGKGDESTRVKCGVDITFEFKIETLLHILKYFKKAFIDEDKKALQFKNDKWTHVVSLS